MNFFASILDQLGKPQPCPVLLLSLLKPSGELLRI